MTWLASEKEAADHIGLEVATFRAWVSSGRLPQPIADCGKFDLKAVDQAVDRISGIGSATNALDAWRAKRQCETANQNKPEHHNEPKQRSELKSRKTALYRHFDSGGGLLYAGISLNAVTRLADHRTSDWFDQIAHVEIEQYPDRETALAAEREVIRTEKPAYNIVGKVAG
jgi:hypothetical protein